MLAHSCVYHSLIIPFTEKGSPLTYSSAASRDVVTVIVPSGSARHYSTYASVRSKERERLPGRRRTALVDDADRSVDVYLVLHLDVEGLEAQQRVRPSGVVVDLGRDAPRISCGHNGGL